MNRAEWQRLATERLLEAEALLKAKRWSGAYYLAGYAVEGTLKSCVLAYVERTGVIFEDRKYAEKCWTHDLAGLMALADLMPALGAATAANRNLGQNWNVVKVWTETSRYQVTPHHEAKRLVRAINDKTNGVMSWIANHW